MMILGTLGTIGRLVRQARDQRLIRQALRQRPLLNRLQVLARQPDVQPPVLAERGLRVAGVPSPLALAAAGGPPLAALDGLKQLLLGGVNYAGNLDELIKIKRKYDQFNLFDFEMGIPTRIC